MRRLVAEAFAARTGGATALPRLAVRLGVAGVTSVVLLGSGAVAAAVLGSPVPDPVREVSYQAGLPVDSVDLHHVRHDMEALKEAIDHHQQGAAQRVAEQLTKDLKHLSGKEHAEVGETAENLIEHAGLPAGHESPAPVHAGDQPATTAPSSEHTGQTTTTEAEHQTSSSTHPESGGEGDG